MLKIISPCWLYWQYADKNLFQRGWVLALVLHFVHCRLDYCNSVLTGAADVYFKRLQSVQNAAARLVSGARRHDHITTVLTTN